MTSTAASVLDLLNKALETDFSIKVWVPSLLSTDHSNSTVQIKPLTISQQKQLLSAAVVQDLLNINFNKLIYTILRENYLSENIIPFKYLTVLDKLILVLSIRANINSIYNNFDLNQLISKIQHSSNFEIFVPKTFENSTIKIHCAIPTIETEYECEVTREEVDTDNKEPNEQLQTLVTSTITNELTKVIYKVNIKDQEIVFNDYTFKERIDILNQLPAFLIEKVLDYALQYKKEIENYLKINDTETLVINSIFFSTV